MENLDNCDIKDFISVDVFNDTSLFAIKVVDIMTYEVIYVNQAMKNIMADSTAKNCWEAVYGQESPCAWCKVPDLIKRLYLNEVAYDSRLDDKYITYENFNEVANKWYLIQEKVLRLEDDREVLISYALDISMQKEAQSKMIDTHVKLQQQTQALREAQKELKEQACRDPLTKLYNRRYFQEISEELVNLAKRESTPVAVVMIDIDKFKSFNDSYGHSIGDDIIKAAADLLIEHTRKGDVIVRYGGEEFAIVLPNTDKSGALTISKKIREIVEGRILKLSGNKKINFTVSIGVDEYDSENDKGIDESLDRADKALYIAKKSGRNRVCTLEDEVS